MNTVSRMFNDADLADMIAELKEWPNTSWETNEFELGVSPFVSFYFLYDTKKWIDTSLLMVDIHEDFEAMMNHPYVIRTHPGTERPHPYGSKRLPDLRSFAERTKKSDPFIFKVSSEINHGSSPTVAGYFRKKPDYMNDRDEASGKVYSSIQLYYRWAWWQENQEEWRSFIVKTIDKLSPEIVYSGFSMANPLEFGTRSAVTVWERALTPHFYGLDIDDPWSMSQLGEGIRPPTWGFLLSDKWSSRLSMSRQQVRDYLRHPEIKIIDVEKGLWIELGKEPSLFPVEEGVPALPKLLNRLIQPIRDDNADLVGFPVWDDDPNRRFNRDDSMRWLRRFDDDSDWPSSELRRPHLGESTDTCTSPHGDELRAKAGEACPTEGRWQSVDASEDVRYYQHGELLANLDSTYGLTIWRYVGP
jgi:hypothetical protein